MMPLLAAVAAFVFLLASAMPVTCDTFRADKAKVLTMLVQANMPSSLMPHQEGNYFSATVLAFTGNRVVCTPMFRCMQTHPVGIGVGPGVAEKKLNCVSTGSANKPICFIAPRFSANPGEVVNWSVDKKLIPSELYTLVGVRVIIAFCFLSLLFVGPY
jgi:hypothetical protein